MREIVLDTETTGFDPEASHKIVEVACVELFNHMRTGEYFHAYINPERDVPDEAFQVHGLSTDFLKDHRIFGHIAGDMLDFIKGSPLIIHNAAFDLKFLNHELRFAGFPSLDGHPFVDTLFMARKAFPGAQASLDALCKRFKIDLSRRSKHGALLDAELLAEVYLELKGGKQHGLGFTSIETPNKQDEFIAQRSSIAFPHRTFPVTEEESQLHEKLVATLPNSVWNKG
ncbi:MAG: DNA polymerase III subunit epsilon [Alphaproteobacteria bacterium]|nr:DNA polymerase III subunit epsilon [Alphaproteobacteria bacterium]OJV47164.1 MAG: DNA polymerase III subunit epsilon [Alphaproteobacteria bacterium 43-37]